VNLGVDANPSPSPVDGTAVSVDCLSIGAWVANNFFANTDQKLRKERASPAAERRKSPSSRWLGASKGPERDLGVSEIPPGAARAVEDDLR
jgi:hypothetical protein